MADTKLEEMRAAAVEKGLAPSMEEAKHAIKNHGDYTRMVADRTEDMEAEQQIKNMEAEQQIKNNTWEWIYDLADASTEEIEAKQKMDTANWVWARYPKLAEAMVRREMEMTEEERERSLEDLGRRSRNLTSPK